MHTRLDLAGITLDVVRKNIKNVHLSVYPPIGKVRISAPVRMNDDAIRLFAISKLSWIRQQQKKLRGQERETPREYKDRESHYVWGERYLLQVIEEEKTPRVELKHRRIILRVRAGTSDPMRQALMAQWFREQIKAAVPRLIKKWEPKVGVKVERVFVQRMKTKWGSSNPGTSSIRFNTDLAKKPVECLEYILVHELVHLRERHHGQRFTTLMDRLMPQWRFYRDELNRSPLGHETWAY